MKFLRNLSLIAVTMCFLFVVGCGSQSSSTGKETATEEAVETTEMEATEEEAPSVDGTVIEAEDMATEATDSIAAEN